MRRSCIGTGAGIATRGARTVALALVLRLGLHTMPMQHIQRGDKELMRILLLIAGQMFRMIPN